MKTRIVSAALAAALTTASGVALAQDAPSAPHHPRGGLFVHADANKDGIVTRAELLAGVDQRFARLDTDKDGKITATDRKAAREARGNGEGRGWRGRGGKRMGRGMGGPRADANKDGVVTLEEARAPVLKIFTYVDRNNDGRIDTAERDQFREVAMSVRGHGDRGPRGHGRHRDDNRHGGHGRHAPPPAGAPEAPNGN